MSGTSANGKYASGVSIIIVSFNSAKTLGPCLESVLRDLESDEEVIVFDNASEDESRAVVNFVSAIDPRVKLIASERNIGFAAGCNRGISASDKEFACLLNPDTTVGPGWLQRMRACFACNEVAAVGPTSDHVAGIQQVQHHVPKSLTGDFTLGSFSEYIGKANKGLTVETKLLVGFCLMARRTCLDHVGLLDENFFLGCDDFDISWRLRLAGYRLLVATDAYVQHSCHASFNTVPRETTDRLVQEAFDYLGRKLLQYYGPTQVPSEEELWGIDGGFLPSFPVCQIQVPKNLSIGCFREDALNIGFGEDRRADIQIARGSCLPLNHTTTTVRFGALTLQAGAFEEVTCEDWLEYTPDVVASMTALRDLLTPGGKLLLKCKHHLAPETWDCEGFLNLFGPGAFDVFSDRPDLVGWADFKMQLIESEMHPTDLGWQLVVNNNEPVSIAERRPRAISSVTYTFVKAPFSVDRSAKSAPRQDPDVSVVFASYNRRASAMRQIDCLLSQTMSSLELFIMGDCCPIFDQLVNEPYMQAKFKMAMERGVVIHTLNLPQNHGTPHGIINYVIHNAKGKYLVFTADDDCVLADHCESYFKSIQNTGCDGMLQRSILVGDYYTTVRIPKLELGHVGHSEIIVSLDLAKMAPPHQAGQYQDWDFIRWIAENGGKWGQSSSTPTYLVNLTRRLRLFKAS